MLFHIRQQKLHSHKLCCMTLNWNLSIFYPGLPTCWFRGKIKTTKLHQGWPSKIFEWDRDISVGIWVWDWPLSRSSAKPAPDQPEAEGLPPDGGIGCNLCLPDLRTTQTQGRRHASVSFLVNIHILLKPLCHTHCICEQNVHAFSLSVCVKLYHIAWLLIKKKNSEKKWFMVESLHSCML